MMELRRRDLGTARWGCCVRRLINSPSVCIGNAAAGNRNSVGIRKAVACFPGCWHRGGGSWEPPEYVKREYGH